MKPLGFTPGQIEFVDRLELNAAASAAIADVGGFVDDVVGDLDEALRTGQREQVERF